jgi:hypothetical protein
MFIFKESSALHISHQEKEKSGPTSDVLELPTFFCFQYFKLTQRFCKSALSFVYFVPWSIVPCSSCIEYHLRSRARDREFLQKFELSSTTIWWNKSRNWDFSTSLIHKNWTWMSWWLFALQICIYWWKICQNISSPTTTDFGGQSRIFFYHVELVKCLKDFTILRLIIENKKIPSKFKPGWTTGREAFIEIVISGWWRLMFGSKLKMVWLT